MASRIDPPPTFAWSCAWIGVPLLALGAYSAWALYNVPVLQDDFSDPASGWPVNVGTDGSVGYHEGAYRIELRARLRLEGRLPHLERGSAPQRGCRGGVLLRSGDEATSAAGVGCLVAEGVG